MKIIKVLLIALIILPITADARGYLVPVIPTATITIGGNQNHTIVTGQNIPALRWKSTNGKSFKTTLSVNNSALCGGIKNNQAWGQSNSAAGSFDLGVAPKAREGCVLTFNYEVTSRTGHQRTDRVTLRYVAPPTAPSPISPRPTTPVVSPSFNPKVEVTSPNGDKHSSNQLYVAWTAENINSDYEFHVYMREGDDGELMMQLGRLRSSVRSAIFNVPEEAFDGKYEIVIFVTQGGADTLLGSKKFYSKPFGFVRDGGVTVPVGDIEIYSEFISESSSAINDPGTAREYYTQISVTPTEDIYIGVTGMRGIEIAVDGPSGSEHNATITNSVTINGESQPIFSNGFEYYKIPKNQPAIIDSVVTISNVTIAGQYRLRITGLSYTKDIAIGNTYFVYQPFAEEFRTSYRTINNSGIIGGIINKINSFGNTLGSVVSGALTVFRFFR
jgi:hypothetical protein